MDIFDIISLNVYLNMVHKPNYTLCLRHSRDNPDLDPGHGRTLQVPHHPEVVLVAGVAGVGDERGRGVDSHGKHIRVQSGPAPGGAVSGVLSPQKAEP